MNRIGSRPLAWGNTGGVADFDFVEAAACFCYADSLAPTGRSQPAGSPLGEI